MKKVIVLVIVVMAVLAGCAEVDLGSGVSENTVEPNTETVLIDNDVVKVTYLEIFETNGFCYLRLKVANKTDKQISVYLVDAYVNDMAVTMMSGVPMDIAPGKMSQNPFIFSGFTKDAVEKIEFKVHVCDENMDTIEENDTVEVRLK